MTLYDNLNERLKKCPIFKTKDITEYFKKSSLSWWLKQLNRPELEVQLTNVPKFIYKNSTPRMGIVDLACGNGRILKVIYNNYDKIGVDINKRVLNIARKNNPNVTFIESDMDKFLDGVTNIPITICLEVFVHIPDIESLIAKIASKQETGNIFITSITTTDFYKGKRPVVHRGIDAKEFEDYISKYYNIDHKDSMNYCNTYYLMRY